MKCFAIACSLVLVLPSLSVTVASVQAQLTTNITDILPYIQRFGAALDLDLPRPLMTNDVTRFVYGNLIQGCGITIRNRWDFGFLATDCRIDTFTDTAEIDGLRERVNHFNALDTNNWPDATIQPSTQLSSQSAKPNSR